MMILEEGNNPVDRPDRKEEGDVEKAVDVET